MADVAAEIEWAKARLVPPEGYEAAADAAGRRPPRGTGQVAQLYARYEAEKRRLADQDWEYVQHYADAKTRVVESILEGVDKPD